MNKTLIEIHEDVPPDHYDKALKRNIFQIFWHSRRFSETLKQIKPVKGRVLDVGCHSGTFTSKILSKLETSKIYGIDISPESIKLAGKRIPRGKFKVADASKLPYKSDYFDAVFCLEVLEHVDKPLKALEELKRVLKKGGYGIILVPTDSTLFKLVWFLWTLYYPVWRHAHVQSYTNDSLDKLIKKAKLKINFSKKFNLGMLKLVVVTK